METILLTGKSGFLGARIFDYYKSRYNIIAPLHKNMDITNKADCVDFVLACKPDFIIHTTAISDTGYCQNNPEESYRVNVVGPVNLAKACVHAKSKLVFMSSDQVYSGSNHLSPNREIDTAAPENIYGQHKLEAEQQISAVLGDAVCLRLTWMFDLPTENLDVKRNFLTNILNTIQQKSSIRLSDNEHRSVTYVKEVVENISKILTLPSGIYNAGSENELTTYMLGRKVYELLNEAGTVDEYLTSSDYFRNLSICNDKISGYGVLFSKSLDGMKRCLSEHKNSNG